MSAQSLTHTNMIILYCQSSATQTRLYCVIAYVNRILFIRSYNHLLPSLDNRQAGQMVYDS